MGKRALGVLLGGIVYFLWGALSWMVLPWHKTTIKALPQEQLVRDVLKTVVIDRGFYVFPSMKTKIKEGPAGVIAYDPSGARPMGAKKIVVELLVGLGVALIGMAVLLCARDRVTAVVPRATLVAALGAAAWLSSQLPYWNWFYFPSNVTLVALADSVIGFFLTGFILAPFVEA